MTEEQTRKQMNENKPSWLGVLVIIVIILAVPIFSYVWPRIQRNIRIGKRLMCSTNLVKLGKAMWMYSDNFGEYPTPDKWCDLLLEHTNISEDVFRCPGNKKHRCSYALNLNARRKGPDDMVVLFETKGGWNQAGGVELLATDNHTDSDGWSVGANILFNDGHVAFEKRASTELNWKTAEQGISQAEDVLHRRMRSRRGRVLSGLEKAMEIYGSDSDRRPPPAEDANELKRRE
jgi:prepilin-type processing-associated H-X9-DG protein